MTDASGKVVTRMSYMPYGEKVKTASSGPDIFHQKYTGQVDDGDEAGLMYYNARYYDPAIGRFISADSVIPDPSDSQSFNRYMYVLGNPISFNDPSGHVGENGPGSAGPSSAGADHGYSGGPAPSVPGDSGSGHGNNNMDCHWRTSGGESYCTNANSMVNNNNSDNNEHAGDIGKNDTSDSGDTSGFDNQDLAGHGDGGRKEKFGNPLPSDQMVVWSEFGPRVGPKGPNFHKGIDLGADMGTPVFAAFDGRVDEIGYSPKHGDYIIVRHKNNLKTLYGHLSATFVPVGWPVFMGNIIAATGNSGKVGTYKHLHFMIYLNGDPVDPRPYLNLEK